MNFKPDRKESGQIVQAMALLSQLGLTMAVCVIIGVLLGKFLDDIFKTSPWLVIAFSILGVMSALKTMYDMAMKTVNNSQKTDDKPTKRTQLIDTEREQDKP